MSKNVKKCQKMSKNVKKCQKMSKNVNFLSSNLRINDNQ